MAEKLALLPDKPGCYLMRDSQGEVLYVGKARSLKNRVRSYFQKGHGRTARIDRMVGRVYDFDTILTDSEIEALILENTLIKQHKPYFNVRLRDDKQYPYLKVTLEDEFPRVFIVRQPKQDENKYYGPYTNSRAVYKTLQFIRQAFQLASCKLQFSSTKLLKKPCLYHHINQCLAPCVGYISPEEYGAVVKEVCLFLEGKHERLLKRLEQMMVDAAERLDFEGAAKLRDQREALLKMMEHQKVVSTEKIEQDVIAFVQEKGKAVGQILFIRNGKLIGEEHFLVENGAEEAYAVALSELVTQYYEEAAQVPREILLPAEIGEPEVVEEWLREKRGGKVSLLVPQRGEKRRLVEMAESNARESLKQMTQRASDERAAALEGMEQLQDVLDLPALPERIECYDISNIQGTEAVGSMVVLRDGKPARDQYRRFKIKGLPDEPNDFLMMQQVLRRRLQNGLDGDAKFLPMPDLIVIDGGKGQLSAAGMVMEELGVQLPMIGLAKREEEVFVPGQSDPVDLPKHSPGNHMLQRIRDEAHRFALTYHRTLRGKQAVVSMLDQIPGVGKTRRTALLKQFGSVAQMKEASEEELAKAPGMNKSVAASLYKALHEEDEAYQEEGEGAAGDGGAAYLPISPARAAKESRASETMETLLPKPGGGREDDGEERSGDRPSRPTVDLLTSNVIGRREPRRPSRSSWK
ncbi:MAG: excinuclease ABC subunit UvrC [Armatimonadetes bacterium]|nr:excinuclease ABC subunit UvrC [Armatimonadota bacterium]